MHEDEDLVSSRRRPRLNVVDLLDLDPLGAEIMSHLIRAGARPVDDLALALKRPIEEIESAVENLVASGRLVRSAGEVRPAFGRRNTSRALPSALWEALVSTTRSYSGVEVAALREAMPMLQFARARMGEFADHGPGHALRVQSLALQLSAVVGLSTAETHLVRLAALFHDVGNAVNRAQHHVISAVAVERLVQSGDLPLSLEEGEVVALLCRWHRDPPNRRRQFIVNGEALRLGLMSDVLRIADAMDIDFRRVDHPDYFRRVIDFFFPEETPFWTTLEDVFGVRIRFDDGVRISVYTRDTGSAADNMQVAMLRKDLAATELDWTISAAPVPQHVPLGPGAVRSRALLVFPMDPHSLVMAAISRKHLRSQGYAVDLACALHPEDALPDVGSTRYGQIVLVGLDANQAAAAGLLSMIGTWRDSAAAVTWLSRHYSDGTALSRLHAFGVASVLGANWSYFWGEPDLGDLAWSKIAALSTRDAGGATPRVSADDDLVLSGLLESVYAAHDQSHASGNVESLADDIMGEIEAGNRQWFRERAAKFSSRFSAPVEVTVAGKTVLLTVPHGSLPPWVYWRLEAAVESSGRALDRGILFKTPYAIAVTGQGEIAHILAMNHWRDERAAPIRLLYPTELGPVPQGYEMAIGVDIPRPRLQSFLSALIRACNTSY